MYLLYSATLLCCLLVAAPYFLYHALIHRKYLSSLGARLGLEPPALRDAPARLLVHCVSVGEFLAAEPLLLRLRDELPGVRLVITTTTDTGQQLARERAAAYADICYFPIDFAFAAERLLARVEPVAVVIMETEIWPNFMRAAARRNIPVIIANGRISDRSFARYRLVRMLLKPVLAAVTRFMMQSQQDAGRIGALGAPPARISVCGNIKYDLGRDEQSERRQIVAEQLAALLDLRRSAPLVVAGSTTPGEEQMLVEAFMRVRNEPALAATRLLLAPRRPERFDEVAALLSNTGLPFVRRSALAPSLIPAASDNARALTSNGGDVAGAAVILLDSIGELAALYAYAALVFVGGSLVPKGGHNILEPALYGRAIITGPYMNNFHKIMADFVAAGAVVQLPPNGALVDELSAQLVTLLTDSARRDELGARARRVLEENRGALDEQAAMIVKIVKGS